MRQQQQQLLILLLLLLLLGYIDRQGVVSDGSVESYGKGNSTATVRVEDTCLRTNYLYQTQPIQYANTVHKYETRTKVIWQKNGIALTSSPAPRLYSLGGSIGLTVWLQFATECSGWGFDPKSTLHSEVKGPNLTLCVSEPHKCISQMAS